MMDFITFCSGIIVIYFWFIILKLIFKKAFKRETVFYEKDEEKSFYYVRKELMTSTEKSFYFAIRSLLPESYVLLPQINLATIVQKTGDFRYQNELFRNIDFGIFDSDFNLIVLIEINDSSHNEASRVKRDMKVKAILEEANIPLITLHTKYGINLEYIDRRLLEYIR